MIEYLVTVGFLIAGFVLMALALQFSKYKQNESSCCGGGHCSVDYTDKSAHSGLTESVDMLKRTIELE